MKVQCTFINFENENLGDMNDLYNTQKSYSFMQNN